MYVRFETLPDLQSPIFVAFNSGGSQSGYPQIRFRPSQGDIIAAVGTTVTGAEGFVPSLGEWYRLDFKWDVSGSTATASLTVNGSDKGTASRVQAATTNTVVRLGVGCTGEAVTADVVFDDFIMGTDISEYPVGEGQIIGLFPNSDGGHSFSTPGTFIYDAAGGNISDSATDTWTYIDHTMGSISTFLNAAAALDGDYLEWNFADLGGVGSIKGLEVVSAHHATDGNANRQAMELIDGVDVSTVFSGADFSQTGLVYNTKHYAVAPSSSVAWTKEQVDGLKARWYSALPGGAADTSPDAYIDGLVLEVDYIPQVNSEGSGAPVTSLSETADGDASQTFPVSGAPVTTLSPTASSDVDQVHSLSGAPVTDLSKTADGDANQQFTADGDPVTSLSETASGSAHSLPVTIVSGAPVTSLSPTAEGDVNSTGTARFPVKGGRSRIYVYETPAPKKKKPRPKPEPVYEVNEQPVPELVLPESAPIQIPAEFWAQVAQMERPRELPTPEPETFEPIGDIETRLLQHFIETIGGMPDLDDVPYFMQRFLRMGQQEQG